MLRLGKRVKGVAAFGAHRGPAYEQAPFMGYGARGQTTYLSPFSDPTGFVAALPSRVLAFSCELFMGGKAFLISVPSRSLTVMGFGVLGFILLIGLLLPAWKAASKKNRSHMIWLSLGMLGAMVPLSARVPASYVMIVPFIGGALLAAWAIGFWLSRIFLGLSSVPIRVIAGLICLAFLLIFFVQAPFTWYSSMVQRARAGFGMEQFHHQESLTALRENDSAVFLNINRGDLLFHGYFYRRLERLPIPEHWWSLSATGETHQYTRTDRNTLILDLGDSSLIAPFLKGQIRGTLAFRKDQVIDLEDMVVTILDVNRKGASKVSFTFAEPLEQYRLLAWQEGELRRIEAPPVGESITLAGWP